MKWGGVRDRRKPEGGFGGGISPSNCIAILLWVCTAQALSTRIKAVGGGINGLNIEPGGSLSAKNSHR